MCGPLGVSHLLLFTRSNSGNVNLRIAISPRGPTLHFRVENYSLCKDIVKALKHPVTGAKQPYLNPPLLVMNNFTTPASTTSKDQHVPKNLESLITTVFQSLFPPIAPQTTPLTSIKRVLLLDRAPQPISSSTSTNGTSDDYPPSYILYLRHYHINTKVTGLPRPLRRLNNAERAISGDKTLKSSRTPNLGRMEDVADYFLGDPDKGYVSASETEAESDAEVEVLAPQARKVIGRRERDAMRAKAAAADGGENGASIRDPRRAPVEKRAVKLTEIGPRMKLRLTKVEEGLCQGKVLWHEFIKKTKEEEMEMDELWEQRNKEKAERKRVQRENVERKKKEKKTNGAGEDEDEDEEMEYDSEDMDWDDDEWNGADAGEDDNPEGGVEIEAGDEQDMEDGEEG